MPMMQEFGLDRLADAEKRQLIEELEESLTYSEAISNLTDDQKREIERRLAAHRANPERSISWEEMEAKLLVIIDE